MVVDCKVDPQLRANGSAKSSRPAVGISACPAISIMTVQNVQAVQIVQTVQTV